MCFRHSIRSIKNNQKHKLYEIPSHYTKNNFDELPSHTTHQNNGQEPRYYCFSTGLTPHSTKQLKT